MTMNKALLLVNRELRRYILKHGSSPVAFTGSMELSDALWEYSQRGKNIPHGYVGSGLGKIHVLLIAGMIPLLTGLQKRAIIGVKCFPEWVTRVFGYNPKVGSL